MPNVGNSRNIFQLFEKNQNKREQAASEFLIEFSLTALFTSISVLPKPFNALIITNSIDQMRGCYFTLFSDLNFVLFCLISLI